MAADARNWEERMSALWASADEHDPSDLRTRVQLLADELPPGEAVALFEVASAHDYTECEEDAARLYQQALDAGLSGERRRCAIIQLASTLRNLGRAADSVDLLRAERQAGSDHLDDAVDAFLALALVDTGQRKEAAALALSALSHHLPMYNRPVADYAGKIVDTATFPTDRTATTAQEDLSR